jgi:hypothetical protein
VEVGGATGELQELIAILARPIAAVDRLDRQSSLYRIIRLEQRP